MEIIKKISQREKHPHSAKAPTIVFFGDSVTQGCFEVFTQKDNTVETVYDPEFAYHKYLSDMIHCFFPASAFNIINAGISGDGTHGAISRMKRDVLTHTPDLTVVCFGLNDAMIGGEDAANEYGENLRKIFTELTQNNSEVIFMTPNMMCTNISCHIKENTIMEIAEKATEVQNNGVFTKYILKAKEVASQCGVKVCDVYSKWLKMNEYGVNTTELLANKINHPTRKMNMLFAWSLIETMFDMEE